MHDIKDGPNIVTDFRPASGPRAACDYAELPSRGKLVAQLANPLRRKSLPDAPDVKSIIMQSMTLTNREPNLWGEEDLLFTPPLPRDMAALDWHRHSELVALAYDYARRRIEELDRAGDPVIKAIKSIARPRPMRTA